MCFCNSLSYFVFFFFVYSARLSSISCLICSVKSDASEATVMVNTQNNPALLIFMAGTAE